MPQVNEISWSYTSFGILTCFIVLTLSMNYFLFKEELSHNSFFIIFYAATV